MNLAILGEEQDSFVKSVVISLERLGVLISLMATRRSPFRSVAR